LNTFFKVYPTAKKTELLYYTNNEDIKEINKDYLFSEIKQINYFNLKEGIKVAVVAVYLDKDSKVTMPFTYTLTLTKTETNWIITNGI